MEMLEKMHQDGFMKIFIFHFQKAEQIMMT